MSFDDNWMDQSRRLALKGQAVPGMQEAGGESPPHSSPAGDADGGGAQLGAEPPPAVEKVKPSWVYHGVFVAKGAMQRALLRRGRPVAVVFDLYEYESGLACTRFPYPPWEMVFTLPMIRELWDEWPVRESAIPPLEERIREARRACRHLLECWAEGA